MCEKRGKIGRFIIENPDIIQASFSTLALVTGISLACLYYNFKKSGLRRHRYPKSQGLLLFTSDTGRILAHRLRHILSTFLVNVDLVDFKEYVPEDLPNESLILIVASLEKDGNLSRSAQVIVQWLSSRAADLNQGKLMEACRFGVFNVSSQVAGKRYNALGRDLSLWMRSLGASEILPLAEGYQENEDLDEVFSAWSVKLIYKLKAYIKHKTEGSTSREMPTMSNSFTDPWDSYKDAADWKGNVSQNMLSEEMVDGEHDLSENEMSSEDSEDENHDIYSEDMSNEDIEGGKLDDDDHISYGDSDYLRETTSPTTGSNEHGKLYDYDTDMSNEDAEDGKLDECDADMLSDNADDLKETTSPNTETTNPKNEVQIMAQDTIIYVLFEHKDKPKAKPDAFSVASLYRIHVSKDEKWVGFSQNIVLRRGAGLIPEDPIKSAKPLGLPLFNFTPKKYPSGMGCGAVDGKLFFVGGGFDVQKPSTENYPSVGNSNKMYILDTSSIGSSTTEHEVSKNIQIKNSICLNKYDPIVEVVNGKLFVLPNNFGSNGTDPTIDSYDPSEDEWKRFDIFKKYKGRGSLKRHPPLISKYKVQAHYVKHSIIYICLTHEAYGFNTEEEKLFLIGDGYPKGLEPLLTGKCIYIDGYYLGLDLYREYMFSYHFNPYRRNRGRSSYMTSERVKVETSLFAAENMRGVISSFGDTGEDKRLLVARIGQKTVKGQVNKGIYLSLDFQKMSLVPFQKSCHQLSTYGSFTYHIDHLYASNGDIKACFPICLDLTPWVSTHLFDGHAKGDRYRASEVEQQQEQ